MGVHIKGMNIPESCYFCPLTNDGFYLCKANNPYKYLEDDCEERRPDWCPLVPVPPHGRCVDADLLCKVLQKNSEDEWNNKTAPFSWAYAYDCVRDTVENMPTIIPTEDGE